MQAGVGLLVLDVMPTHMIIPRYSHNYAQFCQLLNSNLFTTVKYLCSWENPLVKPMAPGSIFIILILQYLVISFAFILLCIFITKHQKYYSIISIRSHSRKWPWRDWQPLFCVVCKCLLVCAGACIGDLLVPPTRLIPWFLTEGNTYLYFVASPFPLQGKNQWKIKK